jgi:hypothetical protein
MDEDVVIVIVQNQRTLWLFDFLAEDIMVARSCFDISILGPFSNM